MNDLVPIQFAESAISTKGKTLAKLDLTHIIQITLYGYLVLILLVTAVIDIYHRRIPNRITYSSMILFLCTYTLIGGWNGLFFSMGGLVFGFTVFIIPYSLGGMGAGDVKLMAAVGAALGFGQTFVVLLFTGACGCLLALAQVIHRRTFRQTMKKIFLMVLLLVAHNDGSLLKNDKTTMNQDGIPFGLAIASAVFLFFLYIIVLKGNVSMLFDLWQSG